MNNLPEKPSELLRIALRDLEQIEKDPDYGIDMSVWHNPPRRSRKCKVCLSGAVMALELDQDPNEYANPCYFSTPVGAKLDAINFLRRGYILDALRMLKIELDHTTTLEMRVTSYSTDPKEFKKDMWRVIRVLQADQL